MIPLTTAPFPVLVITLVAVPTLVSMATTFTVRHRVPLEVLSANNEVAGFKFAVVGVLYAVLLAFAVVVVWQSFSEAEDDATTEAGAAATLYRLSEGYGDDGRELRTDLDAYVASAIHDDWPAMARGGGSHTTTLALDELSRGVLGLPAADARQGALLYEILYQVDRMTQARRARLDASAGFVPWVIWMVLYLGGLLTVGFTHFFGTRSVFAQMTMTGILTSLIGVTLVIVVAIDSPFAGAVEIPPDSLLAVQSAAARMPLP